MTEQKTKATIASVPDYLQSLADDRRADCQALLDLMRDASGGVEPRMWGPSMVGFGEYHYKYASGHEGDCMIIGFASRRSDITVYVMPGLERYDELLSRLGKHKAGKGCLYIKKLEQVDKSVLKQLLTQAVTDAGDLRTDR